MKTKRVMFLLFFLFLLAIVGVVQASSVFVLELSKEVTQEVQSNGCNSIGGNVSTIGGTIDFYVTDPSGTSLLCYENISSLISSLTRHKMEPTHFIWLTGGQLTT